MRWSRFDPRSHTLLLLNRQHRVTLLSLAIQRDQLTQPVLTTIRRDQRIPLALPTTQHGQLTPAVLTTTQHDQLTPPVLLSIRRDQRIPPILMMIQHDEEYSPYDEFSRNNHAMRWRPKAEAAALMKPVHSTHRVLWTGFINAAASL